MVSSGRASMMIAEGTIAVQIIISRGLFKLNNLFTVSLSLSLCIYSRINGQLIVLTSALQTWTQLEVGLGEFTHGLDKYRTLYELKDVLDRGEVQLPTDTVMDVRQVSRLLTERIEAYQQVSKGIRNKCVGGGEAAIK